MLIWMTLLILGVGDGGGTPPATNVADFFVRRRRRGWTPKA